MKLATLTIFTFVAAVAFFVVVVVVVVVDIGL
jgi:hypothetical protein